MVEFQDERISLFEMSRFFLMTFRGKYPFDYFVDISKVPYRFLRGRSGFTRFGMLFVYIFLFWDSNVVIFLKELLKRSIVVTFRAGSVVRLRLTYIV